MSKMISTSYEFLPGSPEPTPTPTPTGRGKKLRRAPTTLAAEPSSSWSSSTVTVTTTPPYIPSNTCTEPTTFVSTVQSTTTVTETETQTATPVRTVYPCADPVDYQGPTVSFSSVSPFPDPSVSVLIPPPLPSPSHQYGDAHMTTDLELSNTLYRLSSPEGGSAQACCEACHFGSDAGITNCVQAYWYSYQGCVVSQATNTAAGSGEHVSPACPRGLLAGLTYGPDVDPAFRSTGNIAGPCGWSYTNF